MRRIALGGVVATAALVTVVASATPQQRRGDPERVVTRADAGKAKLDDALRSRVERGATADVHVFVTVSGDTGRVRALLDDDAAAQRSGEALVVGRIGTQAVPKLASLESVVSVGLVQLEQTGEPLGDPDPLVRQRPSQAARAAAAKELSRQEVPYRRAPQPKGSNFEQLRKLDVLDARTHNFTDAWNAGYTGEGVTVGVLDGGTDFGHPDLLGTWQVWSGATDSGSVDSGWNGWPKAFDPFGTLVWLSAPSRIDAGLSWYTKTTAATCSGPGRRCRVQFATRTGPARNFDAPAGTATHTYRFPRRWSRSGTVRLGSHPDEYLMDLYGERPAFLVLDANQPGVYDTVYVDLDHDNSFGDEKPVTKSSPASYRDVNGDGYTDISGGLLYFISDGKTRIPGGLTSFLGAGTPKPAPGALLAWSGDYDPGIGGHGTLTASNVVGQGVINGNAPRFADLPTKDGRVPGAVIGGAPHAKLAPFGDIYFGFDFSTQFGYFLSTARGVDVTSNSYGSSDVDNDGYDAASQEADLLHDGAATTPLFSTGNGAPGFGTVTSPQPSAGIAVGASTQFGGTGWDSIARMSQVVDNDVVTWSNRGPGATGAVGPDLVADGAYSSGDETLNVALDGRTAWVTWGGTSRSTPVAASATALVYQAYRKAHGGSVPGGFYDRARNILKSSAQDLGYDSFTQGSGSLDAGRAVRAAAGQDATVTPAEWRAGDYRGGEHRVFTHLMAPGKSDSQQFTIDRPGTWSVSDRQLRRYDSDRLSFTSSSQTRESAYNFNSPDYLLDVSDRVRRHSDADLMVVRVIFPRSQFDADANYEADQAWRLLTYNWTDVNRDRNLWTDRDRDGAVDHVNSNDETIDGDPIPDFRRSEMDRGEYVRFMYHRAGANQLTTFVRDPRQRMDDGIFIGLQHQLHNAGIDRTNFTIQIDWYRNSDWSWVSHPAQASGAFTANVTVPPNTPYGMYDGAIVLRRQGDSMLVPVSVAVAAQPAQDAAGNITGALQFGGPAVANAQRDLRYNNGSVFGASDWTWRPESGDWRFFFYDVAKPPPEGTQFLADTTWEDSAPFTDLDTLIFGRSANSYQLLGGSDPFGGPYILDTVGKSENTNTGAGVWRFDTATGAAHEVVSAPAQEGLHALTQHQVGWAGGKFDVPFTTKLGSASVTPSEVDVTTTSDSGSFDVTFKAGVDLDGFAAEAFGLSQPAITQEPVRQDDPDDPATASTKKNLTISHASRLEVATTFPTEDVDLYVVYDANNDGVFAPSEIVASSATGTSDESVELVRPADGNYQIWLHGWQVSGTPSITLRVHAIQGRDMTVTGVPSGPVPAGTPVTLHVAYAKPMTAGQDYFGELLLGPATAPSAFTVPVTVRRR